MKQSKKAPSVAGQVIDVGLSDIERELPNIKYQDEEMLIIDDLRDIPDFAACKITFNIGLVCLKGKVQFEVRGISVSLMAGQAFICHSHVLLTNFMASPDIECRAVGLSDRALKNILQAQLTIWNKAMYPNHYYILNISHTHISLFDTLLPAFNEASGTLNHEILTCLLRAGFLLVCDLFSSHQPFETDSEIKQSRMNSLFHQFLNNIAQRDRKKMKVADYASQLCISPKYLSTICHQVSGKSAMTWISEYVIEDVIYYLKNTDLSAKEISHRLGFDNASFFGKFVRTHLGMSPNEYRKKILTTPHE